MVLRERNVICNLKTFHKKLVLRQNDLSEHGIPERRRITH